MPTKYDAMMEKIRIALGEVSVLFMSQEIKEIKIIMPTEELLRIGNKLKEDIDKIYQNNMSTLNELREKIFVKKINLDDMRCKAIEFQDKVLLELHK